MAECGAEMSCSAGAGVTAPVFQDSSFPVPQNSGSGAPGVRPALGLRTGAAHWGSAPGTLGRWETGFLDF